MKWKSYVLAGVVACVLALTAIGAYQYRGLLGFSRSSADVGSSSELSLSQCDNSICARNATTSVPLASFDGYGYDCQTADKYRSIGDYTGDGQEEAYFLYCNQSGDRTLFVVDFATQSVIATSAVPRAFDSYSMFVGSTKDPESKLHPFLANGYGDGGGWGYLCAYRPDITNKNSNDTCGTGFVRIETVPTGQLFRSAMYREIGAYSQDLDHDGWEDINLIYHWGIVTVSPKTLGYVNETMYDVALTDEPTSPLGFHSGRNYGIHNSFSYNNRLYNLIIGGVPVQTYYSTPGQGIQDAMCNVSRFVALLEGDASSRKLAWSDYYGFHSNIFGSYTTFDIQRYGDFENGCIHYFNKQLLDLADKKVIVFNTFNESTPIDRCIPEQQGFYSGIHAPWNACLAKNMKSLGRWSLVVKDLLTGVDLARFPDYYALGVSDGLLAGKSQAFVAVKLPSTEKYPFDISLVPQRTHVAFSLGDSFAIELETPVPEDAIPQITYAQSRDNKGYGSLNNADVILTLPQGKYPLSTTCVAPTISAGFGSDPLAIGSTVKTARVNESVQIAWNSTGTLPLPGTLRSIPVIPTHANSYGIPENSTFTSPSGWYQFSVATPGTYKITFSSTSSCGPVFSADLILTVTASDGSTQDATSGDLDSDGDVDIFDYNALVTSFGQTGQGGWLPADINKNGTIDIFDYSALVAGFGSTNSTPIVTTAPSNVLPIATIQTSREALNYPASAMIDGDPATSWVGSVTTDQRNNFEWIQADLGAVKYVESISWTNPSTPYPASGFANYAIKTSTDGSTWEVAAVNFEAPEAAAHSSATHALNTNARYIRIEVTRVNDGSGWAGAISELTVHGKTQQGEVAIPCTINIAPSDPYVLQLEEMRGTSDTWTNICFAPGTYQGPIRLSNAKKIRLLAPQGGVVLQSSTEPSSTVAGKYATLELFNSQFIEIQGLEIVNSYRYDATRYTETFGYSEVSRAIGLVSSQNVVLRNNSIRSYGKQTIQSIQSINTLLSNNTISGFYFLLDVNYNSLYSFQDSYTTNSNPENPGDQHSMLWTYQNDTTLDSPRIERVTGLALFSGTNFPSNRIVITGTMTGNLDYWLQEHPNYANLVLYKTESYASVDSFFQNDYAGGGGSPGSNVCTVAPLTVTCAR